MIEQYVLQVFFSLLSHGGVRRIGALTRSTELRNSIDLNLPCNERMMRRRLEAEGLS